jgi:hypothetical protein
LSAKTYTDLAFWFAEPILYFGPDGGTRTHDLRYPKPSRYQTALHPDILAGVHGIEPCSQGFGDLRIASFPHPYKSRSVYAFALFKHYWLA